MGGGQCGLNDSAVLRAIRRITGQQPGDQIGQSRRYAAARKRGDRHRPEFDGAAQQSPFFVVQTAQLLVVLAGTFLSVQRQQLAQPALGGGGGLTGEQDEQQQAQCIVVSPIVHRVFTAAGDALAHR